MKRQSIRARIRAAAVLAPLAALLALPVAVPREAFAQQTKGTASGLPVPRYVSLKSDRVNLREGPSKDHRTRWIFQRAGLPVEVTAEFETWRRIRDSEGAEGWVLHSLLSGRRTALVAPWKTDELFPVMRASAEGAGMAAQVQAGVIVNVKACDKTWCRVFGKGYEGFIRQANLWGVYPNETIE